MEEWTPTPKRKNVRKKKLKFTPRQRSDSDSSSSSVETVIPLTESSGPKYGHLVRPEGSKARAQKTWFYTINNPKPEHSDLLKSLECRYHVFGNEIAPTTGTPHIQGCITFKTNWRKGAIRKLIPGAHVMEVIEAEHARNYCMKELDFTIVDNRVGQGERTDLKVVAESLRNGNDLRSIATEHTEQFIKYSRGIRETYSQLRPPKTEAREVEVTYIYGTTGTGKSWRVYNHTRDAQPWRSTGTITPFFNGYAGERVVVFDDVRGDICPFHYLLNVLDIYPMKVNVKFGIQDWLAEEIYITSNVPPKYLYNRNEEDVNQLLRRIHNILEFDGQTFRRIIIHKGRIPFEV